MGVLTETKMRLRRVSLIPHSNNVYSLGGLDGGINVGAEEEILSPGTFDDLVESWLVDWEFVRVPGVDSGLVQVDNGDLDMRAESGQRLDGGRRKGSQVGGRKGKRSCSQGGSVEASALVGVGSLAR